MSFSDDDDDEEITGLIDRPQKEYIPPAKYISKFRNSVKREVARRKSAHKTFGVPNVFLPPPTQFLRKNSRPEVKRDVKHKHYHVPGYQHKLPTWEKIRKPGEGERGGGDEDFKKKNIVNVKKLEPKKPRMYYVDDRRGNSHDLTQSGLYPFYRDRKYSTQLPDGNEKLKEETNEVTQSSEKSLDKKIDESVKGSKPMAKSRKKLPSGKDKESKITTDDAGDRKTVKSSKISGKSAGRTPRKAQKKPMCRYIPEEERAELLDGMKKRFDELMHKFQVLPFLADTPPKAKRKAKMEEDLKQLEKDIELIERNPHIYVYEGDE